MKYPLALMTVAVLGLAACGSDSDSAADVDVPIAEDRALLTEALSISVSLPGNTVDEPCIEQRVAALDDERVRELVAPFRGVDGDDLWSALEPYQDGDETIDVDIGRCTGTLTADG